MVKGEVLHLVWDKSKCKHRMGREWIKTAPWEKDLGMLVDEKSAMCQQCVLAAQKPHHILGCIKREMANRLRKVNSPPVPQVVQPDKEQTLGTPHCGLSIL